MSSKNGKLIVFSAPSGSGKTTLVRYLLAQDIPFGFSISATSRLPRGAEQDGVDYYFLTEAAFHEKIAQNAFLEYEEVYSGNFYGTLRTEVERLWASAKHVLFDIDVVGGLNIKQQFPEECLALFVQPPYLEELEKRLRGRGTDSEETIQQRLAKAKEELAYAPQFDRVIVNDNLETAQQEVRKAIKQFLQS